MLSEALSWFATQRRPSGASASVRGWPPTGMIATRVFVARSKTLTLPWSGLTLHSRGVAPVRFSTSTGEVERPPCPVVPCTTCQKERVVVRPSVVRSVAVTV